jgi:hypothetical protein
LSRTSSDMMPLLSYYSPGLTKLASLVDKSFVASSQRIRLRLSARILAILADAPLFNERMFYLRNTALKTDELSRTCDNRTSRRSLETTTHAGNEMNRGFSLNTIARTSAIVFELFTQEYQTLGPCGDSILFLNLLLQCRDRVPWPHKDGDRVTTEILEGDPLAADFLLGLR